MSGTIGAVILAAARPGASAAEAARPDRRAALLEHVIERAAEAGLDPVVAVVPVWLTRPRGRPTRIGGCEPVPGARISHSLRLGFAALRRLGQP